MMPAIASEKIPILNREPQGCCIDVHEPIFIPGIPKRWLLVVLGFFGFFNVYAMRVNLSVAMVAMVQKPVHPDDNGSSSVACIELLKQYSDDTNTSNADTMQGEFDWDASTQSVILGSFFYGYIFTQIPGGFIAEKYGAKWLYGIGVLITSVFTLLTPYAAHWGVGPLVAVRAIEGLGEGVTFPAMNAMIGRWAPKMERSRMAAIVYSGAAVGNVFSFALSGYISATIGWPSVFYIFGAAGMVWTAFWLLFVFETPEHHPCITQEEIKLIRRGQDSSGVWENGTLSAFPYLMQALLAIFGSFLADKLRSTGRYRINTIRKGFNSVAFFSPAICVALVGYVGCEPTVIIVLLGLAVGLNGVSQSGYNVTHVDMCPEFAGTLMGITNCIANFSGFLAPAFVGYITQSGQTVNNWRIVFFTTSAIYVVCGLVYNFFCTAEPQPWGTNRIISKKSFDEKDNDMRTSILENPS